MNNLLRGLLTGATVMAQFRQVGHDRSGIWAPQHEPSDSLRFFHRPARNRRASSKLHRRLPSAAIAAIAFIFLFALVLLVLTSHSAEIGEFGDGEASPGSVSGFFGTKIGFTGAKVLHFGRGSRASVGDSRYWERDDRRRDPEFKEDGETVSQGRDSEKFGNLEGEKVHKSIPSDRLYNEGGRVELDSYKVDFENSLKGGNRSNESNVVDGDEYDDGIDMEDDHMEESNADRKNLKDATASGRKSDKKDSLSAKKARGNSIKYQNHVTGKYEKSKLETKKKPRNKNYQTCDIKLLNSTTQIVEPVANKKFARFSLQYTYAEERPSGFQDWKPIFSGHQSLREREESYLARDQTINCGFVNGPVGKPSTGFVIKEADVRYMASCHVAVVSCIFGNSDNLRTPYRKKITRQARKNVCFVMFMDEHTLRTLLSEGQHMDHMGFIGLWKIVVVKNLPFPDMRRVGKIPKFLTHRLFPNARYSIWLDSKLRLQKDPILILEYFLWRGGYEYAISNHYDRHCVWEEVLQNKKLNKFNHTVIDEQFAFYQADGLKRFNPSDPHKLLPSYVPEGSFIVRAHTPMSNLFSCLWFNEVDRFTPRDQLSFAYTYLKLRRMNPEKVFYLNMFKDCERRSVAKLYRHRAEDKRNIPLQEIR